MSMKDKKSAAYRQWWEANKARVLADRRERYQNDPSYRQKLKKAAQRRRAEAAKTKPPKPVSNVPKRGLPLPRVAMIGKEQVILYSFGYLRQQSDLCKMTLELWEERGILPDCVYRDEAGRRWYPAQFVEFVVKTIVPLRDGAMAEGGQQWFLDEFAKRVRAAWAQVKKQMPRVDQITEVSILKAG